VTFSASLHRLRPAFGLAAAMMSVWGLVYSFPLYVAPLSRELHADRAAIAGIVVAVLFWGAVVGPALGVLIDRFGASPAVLGGIVLSVLGYAAFSRVQELWQAYVTFAVVLGTGQTLIYLGANVLIARTFIGERATAYGVAYAGLGIGTGLYAFGGQLLIDELGWRNAALLLSLTPLLVIPAVLRLRGRSAARIGSPSASTAAPALEGPAPRPPGPAIGATMGAFVLVLFASMTLGLMDEGIYQNLLPHAVSVGFSASMGALALALVSASYVVGQLIGGAATDRYGPRATTAVAFAVAAVGALGVLTVRAGEPLAEARLVVGALLYGGGLAVLLLVRLATFANRFSGPRFGLLSGIFALAYPVGGGFIVWFGGLAFDLWRSYLPAFAISAAGLVLATAALMLVSTPRGRGSLPNRSRSPASVDPT